MSDSSFGLQEIILIFVGLFFMWVTIKSLKANPKLLSPKNISKSFYTMGLLALLLIAFIGLCVIVLRSS